GVFFFFQAEDGIRDDLVTGVQTCALPIWARAFWPSHARQERSGQRRKRRGSNELFSRRHPLGLRAPPQFADPAGRITTRSPSCKIGRASCRERGSISVGAVGVITKEVVMC